MFRQLLWPFGLCSPKTQTTQAERNCLARNASGRKRLVEIGVFNGVTTLVLRQAMAADGVLWGIGPFFLGRMGYNLDERMSRHTVGKSMNGMVEFIKTIGADAANQYRQHGLPAVEFMFIDGDHSWAGIEADWTGWSPLIAPGGLVALHDSRSYPGREVTLDSVRYTQEVIRSDLRFEVIEETDSVTVLRKHPEFAES